MDEEMEIVDGAECTVEEEYVITERDLDGLKIMIRSEMNNIITLQNVVTNELQRVYDAYDIALRVLDGQMAFEGMSEGQMHWRRR